MIDDKSGWPRLLEEGIAEFIEQSGRLPALHGAPVASWLLSRLFVMSKGNLGIDEKELLYNDGGCVWTDWEVFSQSFNPRGFVRLICHVHRIDAEVRVPAGIDAKVVLGAFLEAVMAEPEDLRKCRVSVIDTDPPNGGRFGKKYVFGWDGKRFLGSRVYE